MNVEDRLRARGLRLPEPAAIPPGVEIPCAWVGVRDNRAFVSGHGPQRPDGSIAGPFGQVGAEVSLEEGHQAARLAAMAMLGSLKRELHDLDRVAAWLTISGFVSVAPGFAQTTNVVDGCSELILDLYGQAAGAHARTAIGVSALPLNLSVVSAAEVEISP